MNFYNNTSNRLSNRQSLKEHPVISHLPPIFLYCHFYNNNENLDRTEWKCDGKSEP